MEQKWGKQRFEGFGNCLSDFLLKKKLQSGWMWMCFARRRALELVLVQAMKPGTASFSHHFLSFSPGDNFTYHNGKGCVISSRDAFVPRVAKNVSQIRSMMRRSRGRRPARAPLPHDSPAPPCPPLGDAASVSSAGPAGRTVAELEAEVRAFSEAMAPRPLPARPGPVWSR